MKPTKEKMMTDLFSSFPSSWEDFLSQEKEKPYFAKLKEEVEARYQTEKVFPPMDEVFSAFLLCPFQDVKVVILGQDPYHEINQADGLAFSVKRGNPLPRSLNNIYKELQLEFGYPLSDNGDLSSWARQGVLLLNNTLTVKEGEANSHARLGWDRFTDDVIRYLDENGKKIVYILWGNFAYRKASLIHADGSRIIHCAHPSPLSANRGFFHSDCFLLCNRYLEEMDLSKIDWRIPLLNGEQLSLL